MELLWNFWSRLGWLKGGTFHSCLSYLASFWNQSERIWYYDSPTLALGHSFCGSSPRHNNFFFSSYPLKAKYVELMGKEKGYNSSYVYWPSKRMVQKELRKLSQWFQKGFLKWYDGGGGNGITSKRIFEVEVFFSSQTLKPTFRLARRGLPHPKKCPLCDQEDETMDHLLVSCIFARQFWYLLLRQVGLHSLAP
jgi:hypothetical protein